MSAWIVSDAHINFIVNFANAGFTQYNSLPGGAALSDPQGVAEILYRENVRSVNYRYPHHEQHAEEGFVWKPSETREPKTAENLVKFLKCLDCLEYQSCERDDYRESQAFKILTQFRGMAISALPGYEQAPWGID